MYPSCILEPLRIHVSRMYLSCITYVSQMYLSCIPRAFLFAGVPTLKMLQGRAKEMKRAKTVAVQLEQLIDLKNLALRYFQTMPEPLTLMPPSGTQLAAQQTAAAALPLAGPPSGTQLAAQQTAAAVLPLVGSSSSAASGSTVRRVINVPMDCAKYDTEGMCFTGPMQVQWIGQLLQRPQQFVLHADGKHKLHHGRWVLMTLGTHYLRYDAERDQLSTSFAPLMYLMSKQVESGSEVHLGSANMLIDALNVLAVQVFGQEMKPGACVSDHCDAYRNAFKIGFPNAELLQCWPHISRKFQEGEYVSTTWEHFDEAKGDLYALHLARSPEMWELLVAECGKRWDKWGGGKMNTFWNSNCIAPWSNWYMGRADVVFCTPSQNAQESWHRDILRSKIPGMFRGSTETVFMVALPQLIIMDGILMPTVLPFSVPAIPKAMLVKALYYINNQETHVRIFQEERADQYSYYVLKKDNEYGAKNITSKLIELFEAARGGVKDTRIKDHATLLAVCDALHVVGPPADGQSVLPCEGNPCGFDCKACKAFKQVGICSHVLTINHILTRFNVRFQLKEIQTKALLKKAGRMGNNRKAPVPALQREPQVEPDSSDEEAERLELLGQKGK
jgi:hypothetical protein